MFGTIQRTLKDKTRLHKVITALFMIIIMVMNLENNRKRKSVITIEPTEVRFFKRVKDYRLIVEKRNECIRTELSILPTDNKVEKKNTSG